MEVTAALRRALQINADSPATIDGERQHSYGEFVDRIARFAAGLREFGIGADDRVAILALNSDRYEEAYFAIPWAGAAVVPLNTRWAAPEVVFALNDSGAKALIVDAAFADLAAAMRDDVESIETVLYIGHGEAAPAGMQDLETMILGAAPIADAGRRDADLYGIFYTGGTTGRAKGVMLSHRNIAYNGLNVLQTFGLNEQTRWLHAAPMFHVADHNATVAVTAAGGTHVFVARFEPEAVMRVIARDRPNYSIFVPTMINMLLRHPKLDDYDLSAIADVMYGASPMPEAVLREAIERLKGWRFAQGYGMTELSPLVSAMPWRDHILEGPKAKRLKSAGRAVCGVEVKIVDQDGTEVPRGEVGEIVCRGDNVMLGYWQRPDLTAEAVREGWMHTGDAATMDEDGFITIIDRLKDMIISGGENIYSAEVEQAVYQHAAVAECAVIGIPSDEWGEAVHAIVRLKDGASAGEDEIIAHCHTLIAGYKCPRSIAFVDAALPLSGAGKILKTELRLPYWQGRSRQVN